MQACIALTAYRVARDKWQMASSGLLLSVSGNRARILVQVTIYRRLRIGRDGHLDQSEAYDTS